MTNSRVQKRDPLLCDRFLVSDASDHLVGKAYFDSTKGHLLEAKRFVLDESAVQCIAEMIREMPRVIADAQEFAIPPFHKTYIELPYKVFSSAEYGEPADPNADVTIGFLIVGNIVRVLSGGDTLDGSKLNSALVPLEYQLWHPMSEEEESEFLAKYSMPSAVLDQMYWGSTSLQLINTDREGLSALRSNHSIRIIDDKISSEVIMRDFAVMNYGDLRNIIAILLFLNRTREVLISDAVPHARKMVGNKVSTLLSHSTIRLKLHPGPLIKKLVAGEGVLRQLHDVRGHFCHDARARESGAGWCSHEWKEVRPLSWTCTRCTGNRWWRHEHKRGHADVGSMTSDYKVTK